MVWCGVGGEMWMVRWCGKDVVERCGGEMVWGRCGGEMVWGGWSGFSN